MLLTRSTCLLRAYILSASSRRTRLEVLQRGAHEGRPLARLHLRACRACACACACACARACAVCTKLTGSAASAEASRCSCGSRHRHRRRTRVRGRRLRWAWALRRPRLCGGCCCGCCGCGCLQHWGSQLWHHQDGHIHMPAHVQEARDLPDRALILEGEAVLEIGSRAHAHRRASTHLRAQPRAWRDERGRREREGQHLSERAAEAPRKQTEGSNSSGRTTEERR